MNNQNPIHANSGHSAQDTPKAPEMDGTLHDVVVTSVPILNVVSTEIPANPTFNIGTVLSKPPKTVNIKRRASHERGVIRNQKQAPSSLISQDGAAGSSQKRKCNDDDDVIMKNAGSDQKKGRSTGMETLHENVLEVTVVDGDRHREKQ